jgi:hypothetical protein
MPRSLGTLAEHDTDPNVLLADRGYDSDTIREDLRARAASLKFQPRRTAACSTQSIAPSTPCATASSASSTASKTAAATRYDHTAASFLGFAMLASIRQWIRFVHAA